MHEIKDGHGDGAVSVVSYPSPNWVNMNICTSCASLGNKNKMYIVEVNRPSHCTIISSQAQHFIDCYASEILNFQLIRFGERTSQFSYWLMT